MGGSQDVAPGATNAFNGLDCLFTPASQRFHDKGDESDTSSPASPSMGGHLSVPPFTECGTLSYFRRCASSSLGLFTAYVASWFAALRAFRPRVLFFLLHRCELRTTCNPFTIVACAARACHTRKRDAWRSALAQHLRHSQVKCRDRHSSWYYKRPGNATLPIQSTATPLRYR